MKDYTTIQNEINIIGERLVNCNHICQGVIHDCHKGILPRCLIWEERNDEDESGCAVIGLNPGTASQEEMELYRLTPTYDQVVRFWKNESPKIQYYKSLHDFLNQFGITGSILWSELIKCQNGINQVPQLQTFRTCTNSYLNHELKNIPEEWPIFAIGREAYKALAYIYPKRIVIGIPHPTGSHGHFRKLFNDNNELLNQYKISIKTLWDETNGQAIWLSDLK